MNRYILLINICLMSVQLMSMEKSFITTAAELKTLALAVEPRTYPGALEKYEVLSSAVIESISVLLLKKEYEPTGMNMHVMNTREYNSDKYKKQVIEIMYEYYLRSNGQMSFADKINAQIYEALDQKLSEEKNEERVLHDRVGKYGFFGVMGGAACAVGFGIIDFALLMAYLVRPHNT